MRRKLITIDQSGLGTAIMRPGTAFDFYYRNEENNLGKVRGKFRPMKIEIKGTTILISGEYVMRSWHNWVGGELVKKAKLTWSDDPNKRAFVFTN